MNWERCFWVMVVLLFFVLGLWGGFVLHESFMFKGATMIAEGLEGTTFNINVDFNETKMVDRMIEFFNSSDYTNEVKEE